MGYWGVGPKWENTACASTLRAPTLAGSLRLLARLLQASAGFAGGPSVFFSFTVVLYEIGTRYDLSSADYMRLQEWEEKRRRGEN